MLRASLFAFALLTLAAPALAQTAPPTAREMERIHRVLRQTPLIDGHNDLAEQIYDRFDNDLSRVDLNSDLSTLTPPMNTDIPRLRAGGLGGQFWSVYVSYRLAPLEAEQAVRVQMDLVRRIIAAHPETFEFAQSADDVVRIHRAGRIASMFGMEGGTAINENLAVLRDFRASGVMYMTLCHFATTTWCDSATDAPQHGGLTEFGESVVREMNSAGMLVDLAHVSADTMRDALRVSTAPVIFSHSGAYAVCPHPRNVPDDVLALVRANGGVVMVNFYSGYISTEVWHWNAERAAEEARQKALHRDDPDAADAALDAWVAAHPAPHATVAQVADHIEHIRDVAGIDAVGIGSDFDGVEAMPDGLAGVDGYPNLFAELIRRGWSDADLAKLAGGNILRVMRQAERVAARRS